MLEIGDSSEALQDRFARIVRGRAQLKNVHLARVEIDAVCKGSASIDCYAQVRELVSKYSYNSLCSFLRVYVFRLS